MSTNCMLVGESSLDESLAALQLWCFCVHIGSKTRAAHLDT